MLSVARALRAKDIPVELTIQIDSVGFTDYTIPRNVKYSAIFHAWDALVFMTTKSIKVEDPKHTTIVANIVVKDASHLSITRDPRIREMVLNSVKTLRAEIAARDLLSPAAAVGPGEIDGFRPRMNSLRESQPLVFETLSGPMRIRT